MMMSVRIRCCHTREGLAKFSPSCADIRMSDAEAGVAKMMLDGREISTPKSGYGLANLILGEILTKCFRPDVDVALDDSRSPPKPLLGLNFLPCPHVGFQRNSAPSIFHD